ncbi:MAG: hypothetical protein ACKV0T_23140 [Planctomycetales bacterium]
MPNSLPLSRMALAVWGAWVGLMLLLLGMVYWKVWHPHFLPVCLALLFFFVCGACLMVRGVATLSRGPRPVRQIGLLLVGMAPLWFAAGHIMYGFKAGHSRQVRLDLFQKWLIPLAESLIDLESRFRYPQRTLGEKVVMIGVPDVNAQAQVAAMDAHVRALEGRLGRSMEGRVHWFRGPLLGMQGRAIFGVCMGSLQGASSPDASGLDSLDRHEVAHCVVNSFCNLSSDPPALLLEGSAEANMGRDEWTIALGAWKFREQGQALTLAELTGPEWVGRHEWPVYVHGSALVNYLLREFGPDRYLQLHTTGRRAHFAEDCRRILGVDLDQLEHDYWADIERLVGGDVGLARRRLQEIPVANGVDRDQWREFLEAYFDAVPRLLAPYQDLRRELLATTTPAPGRDDLRPSSIRLSVLRSGASRFVRTSDGQVETAALATPEASSQARRIGPENPWQMEPAPDQNRERAYRRVRHHCDTQLGLEEMVVVLAAETMRGLDPAWGTLSALEQVEQEGRQLARVTLEWTPGSRLPVGIPATRATFTFDVADGLCLRTLRYESALGVVDAVQEYEDHDGVQIVSCRRTKVSDPKGLASTAEVRTVSFTSESIPPDQLTLAQLLDTAHLLPAPAAVVPPAPGQIWDWYWCPLLVGGLLLAVGGGLLRPAQKHPDCPAAAQ